MILVQWHNVYLTETGFKLGEGFKTANLAERNQAEFPHFHETTLIPTEIKSDEVLHS